MSEKEIRNALSNNKIVHWYNNLYKVVKSIYNNNLYVVCVHNEFTTLLECCDLKDCYIKENQKMRKIQLKSRVCINSYMRIDKWGDTYWVDDYTSQNGELIKFYKGGYTLFCLGKNDFRYIN